MASITQRVRGKGSWRARVFVRELDGGKKRVVRAKSFRTKKEAEASVEAHARDMKRGQALHRAREYQRARVREAVARRARKDATSAMVARPVRAEAPHPRAPVDWRPCACRCQLGSD